MASLPSEIARAAVQFWRDVRDAGHLGTMAVVILLNLLIGATLSTTQFTQSLMAKGEFKVESYVISTLFLVSFGITKALANVVVGMLSDVLGRRGCMIAGWFLGVWLPVMQIAASNWSTVVSSNLFLGIHQGLCWSVCIFVLLDISGPQNRAFAIGISETSGYTAVAIFNVVAATLIDDTKKIYRPNPQYLVLAMMLLGLLVSIFLLKETKPALTAAGVAAAANADATANAQTAAPRKYVEADEDVSLDALPRQHREDVVILWPSGRRDYVRLPLAAFSYVSFLRAALFAICIAGIITNTLTGLDWGIVTQWYKNTQGMSKDQVAGASLAYSITKGVSQFITGFLSDRLGRREQIAFGLLTNAAALVILVLGGTQTTKGSQLTFDLLLWGSFTLGLGTGIMYPVLLAAIVDWAEPYWSSSALGSFRFWRDLGFAIGGIIAAGVADLAGVGWSFGAICVACVASAAHVYVAFQDFDKRPPDLVEPAAAAPAAKGPSAKLIIVESGPGPAEEATAGAPASPTAQPIVAIQPLKAAQLLVGQA